MIPGANGELTPGLNILGVDSVNGTEIVADGAVQADPVGKGKDPVDVGVKIVSKDMNICKS